MTQEQKDLLLKDLCARLPYGVKVHFSGWDSEYLQQKEMVDTLYSIDSDGYCNTYEYDSLLKLEDVKPYLFPLSSMTEEQYDQLYIDSRVKKDSVDILDALANDMDAIEYLLKNNFDIYGLIPMGLAIDATGLNIY